jgi:hypothetical protein
MRVRELWGRQRRKGSANGQPQQFALVGIRAYSKAQFIRKCSKGVLLEQRADELVHKAQLRTRADVQEVCEQPSPLRAIALPKVLPQTGEICFFALFSVAPVDSRV